MLPIDSIVGVTLGDQSLASNAVIVLIAIMAHKSLAGLAHQLSLRGPLLARDAFHGCVHFHHDTVGHPRRSTLGPLIPPVAQQVFPGVFESVAARTFFHIATVDIIRTEFEVLETAGQNGCLPR